MTNKELIDSLTVDEKETIIACLMSKDVFDSTINDADDNVSNLAMYSLDKLFVDLVLDSLFTHE
jgi:hypothetical protein